MFNWPRAIAADRQRVARVSRQSLTIVLRLAVIAVVLISTLVQAHESFGQSSSSDINPAEQYLQAAADRERAALDLPPLRRDLALVAAAREHARWMVEHNAISHQFASEPDLSSRGSTAGAHFSMISENVAESPSAIKIHEAWMHSEGHRHNLLDPNVDAVGIAVIARGGQLFAVEDFQRTLKDMSLQEQERTVAANLAAKGIAAEIADENARQACAAMTEPSRGETASFVMRYTTADLERLPDQLRSQLASGRFGRAIVTACPLESGNFSMYSMVVQLYRVPQSQ